MESDNRKQKEFVCPPEFDDWKEIRQFQDLQNKVIEAYSDKRSRADRWYQRGGWGLLLFGGPDISGSWRMPLYESRVFAVINLTFFFFGAYFMKVAVGSPFLANAGRSVGFWSFVILFALLVTLWAKFVSKLDKQMRGSERVEAFCCKFLPIRAQLIFELNGRKDVQYKLIGIGAAATPTVAPKITQAAAAAAGMTATNPSVLSPHL